MAQKLTLDRALIRNAQMKATGATTHGVANLVQTYELAVEEGNQAIAASTAEALYVFGATGKLPIAAATRRAAA